jgi:hypothetical protein
MNIWFLSPLARWMSRSAAAAAEPAAEPTTAEPAAAEPAAAERAAAGLNGLAE